MRSYTLVGWKLCSLLALMLLSVLPLRAAEIGGVMVQESIKVEDGKELLLNGAGIRSKFIFDIYIAELYLEKTAADVAGVITPESHKRMVMHFLYDKVEKEKLVEAWNEGFLGNSPATALAALQTRIDQFNALFTDIHKGEDIVLDYVPGTGTKVVIAGSEKGIIPGKDFNDALLLIWLGDEPVTSKLKKALLGE